MATATLNPVALDNALKGLASTVTRDVNEVVGSGQFYVTPELNKSLKDINYGVQNIKLDQQLMASSKEWGNKFDTRNIYAQRGGASQALDNAASVMYDLKQDLGARRVKSLQDSEVRETHHNAMDKLRRAENAMNPYVASSVDHIHQFCDHVGVTDRYTGFRHNMNRGNRDPVRLGYSWLDNKTKNAYNGSLNVGWRPATSSTVAPRDSLPKLDSRQFSAPTVNRSMGSTMKPQQKPPHCIQEQCGINMTFPGSTEYMQRYVQPFPPNRVYPNFRINPAPDFNIYGRPNARAECLRNITECQARYEWPDSAKIDKQPWIRK